MRPILFNTEMVRAILDGRKTQTRRVVKPQPAGDGSAPVPLETRPGAWNAWGDDNVLWPAYQPGDILWVRETWQHGYWDEEGAERHTRIFFEETDPGDAGAYGLGHYIYKADAQNFDDVPEPDKWHPSIHMPREAARIFLRVTDVRVERLWDIQPADICAEGVQIGANDSADAAYESFSALWNSTIKPSDRDRYGWAANPWVWVYTFERIEKGE